MVFKTNINKVIWPSWTKRFYNFVNQPNFTIPFVWMISVHFYVLILLPLMPFHNLILSNMPLTQRFQVLWFAHSDGIFYINIARMGYQNLSTVFFPAWPVLIKITGATFLGTELLALALTLFFFHMLPKVLEVLNFSGKIDLVKLIFILILYPATASLLAPMTEPFYLVLTAATIILVESGNYKSGSLLVALASATRPNGFLLAIYLFLKVVPRGGKIIKKNWCVFPIALSGLLMYSAYLHFRFGSVSFYFEEQKKFGNNISIAQTVRIFTDLKSVFIQIFSNHIPEPIVLYYFASLFFSFSSPRFPLRK